MDNRHAVFGVGGEKCEIYLEARRDGGAASAVFSEWVFAYFSAFNVIVEDTYNISGQYGSNEIHNWLDNYCSRSQRTLFVNAVAFLTQRLFPQRANISPNSDNRAKWEGLLKDTEPATE